jgi:hypothetical protein
MKIFLITLLSLFCFTNITFNNYITEIKKSEQYLKTSCFNKQYIILIDYSKHSSFDRMFLVDVQSRKIINSYKVLHGRGDSKIFSLKKEFSNTVGSNKTALGFSVIKHRGYSSWGINVKYVIEGLEKSNDNNKIRNIVLHSWGGVSNIGLFPIPLPQSKGCPTVSNNTMGELDRFIQKQANKKILIYSFK